MTTATPQDAGHAGHAGETHRELHLVCAGDRVRLLKSIWDDGEDHHPPGLLAMAGDVLVVRSVGNIGADRIAVAHEGAEDSFWISRDEWVVLGEGGDRNESPHRTTSAIRCAAVCYSPGDSVAPCASRATCNHATHKPTPAAPQPLLDEGSIR